MGGGDARVAPIQIAQKGDREFVAIDFSIQCHRKRNGAFSQLLRKIFGGVIHVDANPGNRDVPRVRLRPHFHQDAGDFSAIYLDVVRRFEGD